MRKIIFVFAAVVASGHLFAQNAMTPELLWSLGRVSGLGITTDGQSVIYSVSTPNWESNSSTRKLYAISLEGGEAKEISSNPLSNRNISPDGKYILSQEEVKVNNVLGVDYYPELKKSNAQVYDDIMIRHWDTWEDGAYDHVFISEWKNGESINPVDIMAGLPYNCPQKPFGGDEDYIWHPNSRAVIYVTKPKSGKDYAVSTNTNLYLYDIIKKTTTNLTPAMMGYDVSPAYNKKEQLAFLSMRRDGYESDKQDLVVLDGGRFVNLTASRDDLHVEGFRWSDSGTQLYFWAPVNGTIQLFETGEYTTPSNLPTIRQVTSGDFDITGIVGQAGNTLVVSRTDMNHATELYTVNVFDGAMKQLTHVNDAIYDKIGMVRTERVWVKTTDNNNMLVWVIYPPGFDPSKKYPALLYCQGGPQSPLTQFYSFRWNFQLMASQGYIVVAPNRRGMPGHGTEWNESISKAHGGQVMKDYLSAIDAVSAMPYVDQNQLGCVGASYGGYSAFMLAGMHDGRFKSFIAHDGIYDMRSMYGTTEEMWFVDWDWGGPYWDKKNKAAQRSYKKYNPINYVQKWDTPILIVQGGKDYRVPIEQGLQAFQAAKLRGLNARLLYFPEENHWVLSAQNALVWQREFYRWLRETIPYSGSGLPGRS